MDVLVAHVYVHFLSEKSRNYNVNSIAFCSLDEFFWSNCEYNTYFIVGPRHVLSPSAT